MTGLLKKICHLQEPIQQSAGSRLAGRPRWHLAIPAHALLIMLVAIFMVPGIAARDVALAQYEDANPAVYWRLERQRQNAFKRNRVRDQRKVIIQRPTRLIRRARPRRGYTRAVPVARRTISRQNHSIVRPGITPPEQANNNTPDSTSSQPALTPATPLPVAKPDTAASAPQKPAAPALTDSDLKSADSAAPRPDKPAFHIAVIGDNIGSQLARGLAQTYEETPQIDVMRLTKDNSGLVRKDYYDWENEIRELLAGSSKIDLAVMMIGSNDRQSIRTATGVLTPHSPEWEKLYVARVEAIAALLKKKNIPLIWLGMPVMRLERLSADMVRFNQLYREAVTRQGGLFIDIWEPFLDDRNRFTLYGPDVNGQNVKLRLADGVHFTKAGARKAAHFASIDINRIIERKKNPSAAPVAKGTKLPSAGANNTSNAAGRADPARTIRTAVPTPDAPANVIFPVKPEAGPVVQLTAAPLTPNGELAGAIQKKSLARASPTQNRPPAVPGARTGRADDFSWPKKQSQ